LNPCDQLETLLRRPEPLLALAPMQDVTDLAFWRLLEPMGGADVYWTEYFRVYEGSCLNKWILKSIVANPTGRPVVAQMIGHDIPSLVRTAKELQRQPIAAVDLNLGCPAPVVYRKCAGGGLLRQPAQIDAILGALREVITVKFTVKTRIGFDSPAVFDQLLPIFARHGLDLLTVHGRTVAQGYRPPVRYDLIAQAAAALRCPVLANGEVSTADQALEVWARTGTRGLMIGRGAIRNPWLFHQIRQRQRGETPAQPSGRAVLGYVQALWDAQSHPGMAEVAHVQRLKKFMNYLAAGVGPDAGFLHAIRRVHTRADFFRACATHLDHDRPMPLDPALVGVPDGKTDFIANPPFTTCGGRLTSRLPITTPV
jgi:tRNA-dihydrouridine synthase